jgi:hypothetical protein
VWGSVLAAVLLVSASAAPQEVAVDGIVAVVNQEVITLTDFRIVRELGIHRLDLEDGPAFDPLSILERLIDQKLIILITNADVNVPVMELERLYGRLAGSLGAEELGKKMAEFDLTREELYAYLSEMHVARRTLTQRFQVTVSVTLQEIEEYYQQTYLPQEREKGREPRPMTEILDLLEAGVKSEEIRLLSEEWVRNLRKEADVEVFTRNYPQHFDAIHRKGPENAWQN